MESRKQTLLLARWVCPMSGPPIHDGGVVIEGERIARVGSAIELCESYANADVIDYGSAALLPGLINAHTHLELTNRPQVEFNGDIVDWLLRQRPPIDLTPAQRQAEVEEATRAGIKQCQCFGVTCIGDISREVQWTRPVLAASQLRGTSFGEVLGIGALRTRVKEMIRQAVQPIDTPGRIRIGIGPHAPHTVEWPALRECWLRAESAKIQLSIHLAEFAEEADFTERATGRFREMWDRLGVWDDSIFVANLKPIELASGTGMLKHHNILAHVNYATDEDIQLLSRHPTSVVFCPRTHAYFRHPPHRWRDMLDAGVNVAVGTDSCASSPNLNIVDDLRLLRDQQPSISVDLLWKLITVFAARAMNMENEVGSLTPGKRADVAAFKCESNEPLAEILDSRHVAIDVWIDGKRESIIE